MVQALLKKWWVELKVYADTDKNSADINKPNNHLSPQNHCAHKKHMPFGVEI